MRPSLIIQRYILWAILPYFGLSWLLLSVILFVQQASRFSDIFFSVNIPTSLIWQLTLALVPTVISFTCPMAALVGVIIGLTKMQADGELTAVRAAGASNLQITIPVLVLGVALSAFAFAVNLYGVPLAAGLVRKIATQSAIYKLESPIEPGVFNTEIAGYTIYVREGDLERGTWKNIFIYNEDPAAGAVRLITSQAGRIDYSDERSELVLEKATVTTFARGSEKSKYISESVGELRYAVKTKRGELIQRLGSQDLTPEELGLGQLSEYAQKKEGSDRTEATLLWQRRLLLSITPFIFSLFAASIALRIRRQGRGLALLIALGSLVGYYLLAFLGEQLARTGQISPFSSAALPLVAGLGATAVLFAAPRFPFPSFSIGLPAVLLRLRDSIDRPRNGRKVTGVFTSITGNLRDLDLLANLLRYYFQTLAFLAAVFVIFTAFELWKFAGSMNGGVGLLLKYLVFLVPFIYIQLSAPAAMIATLATYVIKSRQNELVTWLSAGQSIYRLLLPCLTLMLLIGGLNFAIQETILPSANQRQDELRNLIRARGVPKNTSGKYWSADGPRIYSFEPGFEKDKEGKSTGIPYASDNDTELERRPCTKPSVANVSVFEFSEAGGLQAVYRSQCAVWRQGAVHLDSGSRTSFQQGTQQTSNITDLDLHEDANPFLALRSKPSHLTASEAATQRDASESDMEQRTFSIAVEKKYQSAFLPMIVAIFTAPFALSIGRRGKAATVGLAIALWLVFMAVTGLFEQLGLAGNLDPRLAVWSPAAVFTFVGIFLLSRAKT